MGYPRCGKQELLYHLCPQLRGQLSDPSLLNDRSGCLIRRCATSLIETWQLDTSIECTVITFSLSRDLTNFSDDLSALRGCLSEAHVVIYLSHFDDPLRTGGIHDFHLLRALVDRQFLSWSRVLLVGMTGRFSLPPLVEWERYCQRIDRERDCLQLEIPLLPLFLMNRPWVDNEESVRETLRQCVRDRFLSLAVTANTSPSLLRQIQQQLPPLLISLQERMSQCVSQASDQCTFQ